MPKKLYVGLATTCHDPAVAIVDDRGEILFAEAVERAMQNKRAWACVPDQLEQIGALLERFGARDAEVVVSTTWSDESVKLVPDFIAYGQPEQLVSEDGLARSALSHDFHAWWLLGLSAVPLVSAGRNVALALRHRFGHGRLRVVNHRHHATHAMYACWASPFTDAVCLVVDGNGEQGSVSSYRFGDGRLSLIRHDASTGSLGIFYGEMTFWCGFNPNRGEQWKMMGLAPYGKRVPEVYDALRSLLYFDDGGQLVFASSDTVEAVAEALAPYRRAPGEPPMKAADLAHCAQLVYAELMDQMLGALYAQTGCARLVLTGGCALNSAYNGKIALRTPFEDVFVPSAPGDDGNAIGAALLAFAADHPDARPTPGYPSPYLGSTVPERRLDDFLRFSRLPGVRHLPDTIEEETARLLTEGKLVGWVQGRAEFGPRALGNRSILADPRSVEMKRIINGRVKFREPFRPFAPSILHERGAEWFEDYQFSPYMERTLVWRPEARDKVPPVVHADHTGRLQSVTRDLNPRYHRLISAFHDLTGVPLLLNTSFNVMGKPIMHGIEDALSVFLTTGLDVLVVGDYLIEKPAAEAAG